MPLHLCVCGLLDYLALHILYIHGAYTYAFICIYNYTYTMAVSLVCTCTFTIHCTTYAVWGGLVYVPYLHKVTGSGRHKLTHALCCRSGSRTGARNGGRSTRRRWRQRRRSRKSELTRWNQTKKRRRTTTKTCRADPGARCFRRYLRSISSRCSTNSNCSIMD